MDNKYNKFISTNKVYMVILGVLVIILFTLRHWFVGSIFLIVYFMLIIYNMQSSKAKQHEWKKFIEDFSDNLDKATKSTLVNFPFPLIILGNNGNIRWYNHKINKITNNQNILGKNIEELIDEISIDEIKSGKKNNFKKAKIGSRYFEIYISIIASESSSINSDGFMLVYLYEITETLNLIKYIEENKEGVMLLEIDNVEEVLKSVVDDKKPLLIAEIERTINNYGLSLKAMVKKYSSAKYVFSVQEKYINMEMEKKFNILDEMRELSIGNMLAVTLSIGIGTGGESPESNYKYAVTAKDLALGRGGDQAVVKNNDKMFFFGGKTKEVEKRNKVRSRVIAHALVELINESSSIYLIGHISPDIDCLGAALGLNRAVKLLGKESYIVIENANSQLQSFIDELKIEDEYSRTFVNSSFVEDKKDDMSLFIVVDVHNKGNILNYELIKNSKRIVIIDHHRKSKDFIEGALLSYIEPYASSTSEMVTEMLEYMVEKPTLKVLEADALLAGICLDTKNFSFKTGVRTFESASLLRKLGADTIYVKRFFSNSLDSFIKKAEIIKSATVENNMAIAICPPEINDTVVAAQSADELLNITGIQASFVIVKIEDEILISGRSFGEVNVQLILEELGGGGHMTMAGVRLKEISVEESFEKLKISIDKYIMEGEVK